MNQNRFQPPFQPQPRPLVAQNPTTPIEDIVKMLATNTLQFQQKTRSSIQNLEKQISQLATSIGKLEAQSSGKLPSQTIINPRENVSAISLRSERKIKVSTRDLLEDEQKEKVNQEESEAKNKK